MMAGAGKASSTTVVPLLQFCVRVIPKAQRLLPQRVLKLKYDSGFGLHLQYAREKRNNHCRARLRYSGYLCQSYLVLALLILYCCCSPVIGDYPRVLILVEKYPDISPWEFHSRSTRQAQVSRKTWNEYILYKEQTCRTEKSDPSTVASDYFNWEEMTFHKNLRLKRKFLRLLPSSSLSDQQIAFDDAMMLSKIDSRLLAPEAESLCRMGLQDDSEQNNELAEKDRFEDTLISRIFFVPNLDDDADLNYTDELFINK